MTIPINSRVPLSGLGALGVILFAACRSLPEQRRPDTGEPLDRYIAVGKRNQVSFVAGGASTECPEGRVYNEVNFYVKEQSWSPQLKPGHVTRYRRTQKDGAVQCAETSSFTYTWTEEAMIHVARRRWEQISRILTEGDEIALGGELPKNRFYRVRGWDPLSGRQWGAEHEAVYSLGRGICTLVLVDKAAYENLSQEESHQVAGAVIFCKNNGTFAEPTIVRPNISNIPHAVRLFREGRGRDVQGL